MGIHDREYWQDDAPAGLRIAGGPRMIVTNLIIVTVAIALIDVFTTDSNWLSDLLALKVDLYRRPWEFWNLLSYGFAHASIVQQGGIWHVGMNMFMLWMFGRAIEMRLGRLEFLWFYLAAIIGSGLTWLGLENAWLLVTHGRAVAASAPAQVVGASGGITAVFILFVLYYPRETLYVWGVFAVPAWILGAVVIGLDLLSALSGSSGNVAWQAHIGGAAFAFLYQRRGWNIGRHVPSQGRWKWKWPGGARLRLHRPAADVDTLDEEADRILEKLHRQGEQSLSGRERRILEKYSRRMRDKRRS